MGNPMQSVELLDRLRELARRRTPQATPEEQETYAQETEQQESSGREFRPVTFRSPLVTDEPETWPPGYRPQTVRPETAFQSWARRLLIGPMPLVRQQLADVAEEERERLKGERDEAQFPKKLILATAPGVTSAQEAGRIKAGAKSEEARVEAERQKRVSAAARTLGMTDLADLLEHGAKPEELKVAIPKEAAPSTYQDKQGNIRDKSTGKIVEPAPPRKEFTPPPGYVPTYTEDPITGEVRTTHTPRVAPYGLDAIAQQYVNPATKQPYTGYYELPIDLKEAAMKKARELQGEFAFGRATGAEAGQRAMPITKRGEWINPMHFLDPGVPLNPPLGMTTERATASGYYQITDRGDLDALAAIETIPGVIQPLRELTDKVITAKTQWQLTTQTLRGMGAEIGRYIPGVSSFVQAEKLYQESKAAFISNLARALGGEKGVLTNADREKILDGLPNFTDTVSVRDAKWAIIDAVIANAKQAKLKWVMGLPPGLEYRQAQVALLNKLSLVGATKFKVGEKSIILPRE